MVTIFLVFGALFGVGLFGSGVRLVLWAGYEIVRQGLGK